MALPLCPWNCFHGTTNSWCLYKKSHSHTCIHRLELRLFSGHWNNFIFGSNKYNAAFSTSVLHGRSYCLLVSANIISVLIIFLYSLLFLISFFLRRIDLNTNTCIPHTVKRRQHVHIFIHWLFGREQTWDSKVSGQYIKLNYYLFPMVSSYITCPVVSSLVGRAMSWK